MAVGLLGLAAVVIDLGLARATQAQMQSAADAAALEGLRWRDDPTIADAAARDDARRQRASDLVARRFDDDLDPSNGDLLALGAGPVLTLSGGLAGDLNASALLTVDPANRTYDPLLQTNAGDEARGDLVAGDWLELATTHGEAVDYARDDFEPRPVATTAATSSSAFLARLRRTPDLQGLDDDPGVSSRGPALPFLFGLGSAIQPNDPAAVYQPRVDGITVRATAIADGRRVVAVGQRQAALGVELGLLPFTIAVADWSALPETPAAGAPTAVAVAATPLVADPAARPAAIGDAAGALRVLDATPGAAVGYVAITDGGVVVAFGWLDLADGSNPLNPVVSRRRAAIAPQNATAVPGSLVTPNLPASLAPVDGALLAPALVR